MLHLELKPYLLVLSKGMIDESPRRVSSKLANMGLVCACLVVIIHCPRCFDPQSVGWWWTILVQNGLCQIAVPFFFLASGFFLARHMNESGWWRREVLKRVRSLMLPFVIFNITFALCSTVIHCVDNDWPPTWRHWVMFFTSTVGIIPFGGIAMGSLWFVKTLFVLVLFSPLLERLANTVGLMLLFLFYAVFNPYPFECVQEWCKFFAMSMVSPCGMAWFTTGIYMRKVGFERVFDGFTKNKLASLALLMGGGAYY